MLYNHTYGYDPQKGNMKDDVNQNISTKVSPIDKDKATIEAEKGELIVAPDLSTIHKITGKKHSRGGSPIKADVGSFLFSDAKDLSFTKKEKELFGFKLGGVINTPAKILAREVNLKHHNQMYDILSDEKNRDSLSKKTAALMLEKNIEKMGQVAYLQEAKKGFPDGIPDFSKGTAPVYKKDVKDKMDTETQYMRYGGKLLRKMGKAGFPPDKSFYDKFDRTFENNNLSLEDVFIPTPEIYTNPFYQTTKGRSKNLAGDTKQLNPYTAEWYKRVTGDDFDYSSKDIENLQNSYNLYHKNKWGDGYNSGIKRTADGILGSRTDSYYYNKSILPGSKDGEIDLNDFFKIPEADQNKILTEYGINRDKIEPYRKSVTAKLKITPDNPAPENTPHDWDYTTNTPSNKSSVQVKPGDIDIKKATYLDQKVPFTPWQLGNIGYAALQASAIKRYMPYRPQINPLTVELEKINPNQQLNDVDTQFTQAGNLNKIIGNAAQSGANTANLFVKALQSKNQIRTGVDNTNVQIANQQNLTNNQIINTGRSQNTQFNKRYYDEATAAYQNYDIEKRTATNQAVSLANLYKTGNMQLQHALAQQEQFPLLNADGTERKDKNGNTVYGPAYSYDFNGNFVHNRANGLNQIGIQNQTQYNKLYEIYDNAIKSGTEKERTAAMLGMSKLFASKNYPYKMGGTVPKMPKLQKPKFK